MRGQQSKFVNVPACVAFVLASIAANLCYGDRTYAIQDYSAEQQGYSLAGTITTTDDAPLDFLLETSEIVDWKWIIDGPSTVSTAPHDFEVDSTESLGIRITYTTIELPLATVGNPDRAWLRLASYTDIGRGSLGRYLTWQTNYIEGSGQFTYYSADYLGGDVIIPYWRGPGESLGDDSWLIAVAIPEPGTATMAMLLVVFGAGVSPASDSKCRRDACTTSARRRLAPRHPVR